MGALALPRHTNLSQWPSSRPLPGRAGEDPLRHRLGFKHAKISLLVDLPAKLNELEFSEGIFNSGQCGRADLPRPQCGSSVEGACHVVSDCIVSNEGGVMSLSIRSRSRLPISTWIQTGAMQTLSPILLVLLIRMWSCPILRTCIFIQVVVTAVMFDCQPSIRSRSIRRPHAVPGGVIHISTQRDRPSCVERF